MFKKYENVSKYWESIRECAQAGESVLKTDKVWNIVLKLEKVYWNQIKYEKLCLKLRKCVKVGL